MNMKESTLVQKVVAKATPLVERAKVEYERAKHHTLETIDFLKYARGEYPRVLADWKKKREQEKNIQSIVNFISKTDDALRKNYGKTLREEENNRFGTRFAGILNTRAGGPAPQMMEPLNENTTPSQQQRAATGEAWEYHEAGTGHS